MRLQTVYSIFIDIVAYRRIRRRNIEVVVAFLKKKYSSSNAIYDIM